MASRILLTGATGFVGQQVLKFLQNGNSDIILIARRNSEKKIKNLSGISRIIITENLFLALELVFSFGIIQVFIFLLMRITS